MSEFADGGPVRGDGPVWIFGCDHIIPGRSLRLGDQLAADDTPPEFRYLEDDETE